MSKEAPTIEDLDPKADYGEITYEEVVDLISAGKVTMHPGVVRPVLRDAHTGLAIKGTGKPMAGTEASKRAKLQQRLLLAGEEDFPEVYNALMDAVRDGDVRAIKLWMEMVIGRADIMKPTTDVSLMEKMFDMLVNNKQATERIVILEQ